VQNMFFAMAMALKAMSVLPTVMAGIDRKD
jgi:hypothetical protein